MRKSHFSQLRGVAPSPSSFSFVLYSPGLFPWHRNYIFHAQLSVFCLKHLSLSAGLIFIKKKHFQCNPLKSFFVILRGGRSIKKTIYCFNILTLSRCADHKQNFAVYFCNVVRVCASFAHLCLKVVRLYLWGCFCTSELVACVFDSKKISCLLAETDTEI